MQIILILPSFSHPTKEGGHNTADILLSLKNVVVHPSAISPVSPHGSHSNSPQNHQSMSHSDLQGSLALQSWNEDNTSQVKRKMN